MKRTDMPKLTCPGCSKKVSRFGFALHGNVCVKGDKEKLKKISSMQFNMNREKMDRKNSRERQIRSIEKKKPILVRGLCVSHEEYVSLRSYCYEENLLEKVKKKIMKKQKTKVILDKCIVLITATSCPDLIIVNDES